MLLEAFEKGTIDGAHHVRSLKSGYGQAKSGALIATRVERNFDPNLKMESSPK